MYTKNTTKLSIVAVALAAAFVLASSAVCRAFAAVTLPDGWLTSGITYYWIGGTSGNMNDAANWSLTEGGSAVEIVTISGSNHFVFTKDATVTLTDHCNIGCIYLAGNITFTCDSPFYFNCIRTVWCAEGKTLTMAGKFYIRAHERDITINPRLAVTSNDNILGDSGDSYKITVAGSLTGSGTLTCYRPVNFNGGTSGFVGTLLFATASTLPSTLTVASGATVLIPYDNDSARTASGWTFSGGSVKFRLSGTTTATVEANKDVIFPFYNAATVQVFTDRHKAGEELFTCSHGSIDDWDANKIKVYSPNTGAASLFYGTPTIAKEEGVVKIKAQYSTTNTKVWTGAVKDQDWGTAGNWKDMSTGETATAKPSGAQKAIFEKDISFSGNADFCNVLLLGNATFTAGKYCNIAGTRIIEGTGSISTPRLRMATQSENGYIYCDTKVDADLWIDLAHNKDNSLTILHLLGKIQGDKNISMSDSATSTRTGAAVFKGDMSGFTGNITTSWNQDGSYLQFADKANDLSKATVTLGTTGNAQPLCATAGTYTFGSLSGKVTGSTEAVTIKTLATSNTEIKNQTADNNWTLENAGNATVTVTGKDFSKNKVSCAKGSIIMAATVAEYDSAKVGEYTVIDDTYTEGVKLKREEKVVVDDTTATVDLGTSDKTEAESIAANYTIVLSSDRTSDGQKASYFNTKLIAPTGAQINYTLGYQLDESEVSPSLSSSQPYSLTTSAASFALSKAKKGLWYSITAADSPTGSSFVYSDGENATKQANEDGSLSLTYPFEFSSSSNVKYFKIAVSDSEPKVGD